MARLGQGRRRVLGSVLAAAFALAPAAASVAGSDPPLPKSSAAAREVIGGPFSLIDQNGKAVTDVDFRRRFMLVSFGYRYCPDVCPTVLWRNTVALDLLGDLAVNVVPIMISIDPERDTPEDLKHYASLYHPSLVALTGSPAAVTAAASEYRAFFEKRVLPGNPADEYVVDHTTVSFLMGRDGLFLARIGYDETPEGVANRLRRYIESEPTQ